MMIPHPAIKTARVQNSLHIRDGDRTRVYVKSVHGVHRATLTVSWRYFGTDVSALGVHSKSTRQASEHLPQSSRSGTLEQHHG